MELTQSKRASFLPYGRQNITEGDINAVVDVLRSDWLTQGPIVPAFETKLASYVGAGHAVACATGTAALHLAMLSLGVGPGDEIVTTPNTFLATANCARYVGAEVRFADIDPSTGLINPDEVEKLLLADTSRKIKAVLPVHFAGQPADLNILRRIVKGHGAKIVDDACHAIGATHAVRNGSVRLGGSPGADMTVFSFHPVKHVAMGEGGAVVTDDADLAARLRLFRNHGMQKEDFADASMAFSEDGMVNPWYYEMQSIGLNYRLTEMQAALGISQLDRLDDSLLRRNKIAETYRRLLGVYFPGGEVAPLRTRSHVYHAYHLFVVQIDFDRYNVSRALVMNRLREANIGTQVHYIPVSMQPYYRDRYGLKPGDFPGAEAYYQKALSLPMYPELTESDCEYILDQLRVALEGGR